MKTFWCAIGVILPLRTLETLTCTEVKADMEMTSYYCCLQYWHTFQKSISRSHVQWLFTGQTISNSSLLQLDFTSRVQWLLRFLLKLKTWQNVNSCRMKWSHPATNAVEILVLRHSASCMFVFFVTVFVMSSLLCSVIVMHAHTHVHQWVSFSSKQSNWITVDQGSICPHWSDVVTDRCFSVLWWAIYR